MNINILFEFPGEVKRFEKETWTVPVETSLADLHETVQSIHSYKIVFFRLPMVIANKNCYFKGAVPADGFVDIVRDNPIHTSRIDELLHLGLHYIQVTIYKRGFVETITNLDVGKSFDFRDKYGQWSHSIIIDARITNTVHEFCFHFVGFKHKWNEWSSDIQRISFLGSKNTEIKFRSVSKNSNSGNLITDFQRHEGQWNEGIQRHKGEVLFNGTRVFGTSRVVRVLLNGQEKFTVQTTEEILRLCGRVFLDIFEGDPECVNIPLHLPDINSYVPIGYYLKTGKVSFPSINDLADFIKCADFLGADKILKVVPEHLKDLLGNGVIPNLASLSYDLFLRITPFDLKKNSYSSVELKFLKKFVAPNKTDHVSCPWELFQILTKEI